MHIHLVSLISLPSLPTVPPQSHGLLETEILDCSEDELSLGPIGKPHSCDLPDRSGSSLVVKATHSKGTLGFWLGMLEKDLLSGWR